jgi:hypothetical protein
MDGSRLRSTVVAALALLLSGGDANSCGANERRTQVAAVEFSTNVRPLLARYCLDCHGAERSEGELNLGAFDTEQAVLADRRTWKRVWAALHAREMPPAEHPRPTAAERERLTDWIETALARTTDGGPRDPGHVALRRLNRVEYDNTVQDLFRFYRGTPGFDPRKGMPEEVRIVMHRDQPVRMIDLPPDDVGYGYDNIGEILSLPPFLLEKYFQAAGQVLTIAAGEEPVDKRGRARSSPLLVGRDAPPADRERVAGWLRSFVSRAFRRPATNDEVERYLGLYDLAIARGEEHERALKVPLQAVLVSPHFLFKVERGVAAEERDGVRPLSDHELATRLSYFLWSSMPDEELLRLADAGRLRDPEILEQQARRMLRHTHVKQLVENFPPQWLGITNVLAANPDESRYPHFHDQKYLPESLRREALLLFETVLVEDRSVVDLVDPDFAWWNGTLTGYYGVDPEYARERNSGMFWKRYPVTDRRRGGVLTLGASLVVTSDTVRTSPVRRGKWVLETLLGAPPPPPLDNVPDLDNTSPADDGLSLRAKLERHRADPACAACHRRMDPLGFALENFDAAGHWRELDGPLPIDARGTLADGTRVDGPVELKDLLAGERRDDFVRCLAEHLTTYALGRPLDDPDIATLSEIVDRTADDEYRFSRLVVEIVTSHPFRFTRPPQPDNDQSR